MAAQQPKPRHNKFKDLTGIRYGRLVVVEFVGIANHKARWKCRCDCGEVTEVSTSNLNQRKVQSCGCISREQSAINGKASGSHLLYGTRDYRTWTHMIQRCENENDDAYDRYGGRGIAVCLALRQSVAQLVAVIGRRPEGMSLDRFPDVNGNYSCGDCDHCRAMGREKNIRWANASQQASNRRKRKA